MFIPFIKKKRLNRNGNKVVLIGDNLSSHFTEAVLTACEENNVLFVCIPPNSTHLAQPLDVAFYGPLKHYWRAILDAWKKKSKKSQTITKEAFPGLLKTLCNKVIDGETSQNLISGFGKCGIHPFDRNQIVNRIPKKPTVAENDAKSIVQTVSDAVLEMLVELRPANSNQPRKKRTKVNVEPGKSVRVEDLTKKQVPVDETGDLSAHEHDEPCYHDIQSDSDQTDGENEEVMSNLSDSGGSDNDENVTQQLNVSDYVVIKLISAEEKYSIAKIIQISDGIYVKIFTKIRNKFVEVEGELTILPNQVVKPLLPPIETRRGLIFNDNDVGCITFK